MGKTDEAEPLFRDTLERCIRIFGDAHPGTFTCTRSLCNMLTELGRADEAVEVLTERYQSAQSAGVQDSPPYFEMTQSFAVALASLDRHDEAKPKFEEALGGFRAMLPGEHPRIGHTLAALGNSQLKAGDAENAEPSLLEAYEILSDAGEADSTRSTAGLLAEIYQSRGENENATLWRSRAAELTEHE